VAFPYAARAGCADALAQVERLLAEGNGAARQREAFARGGMQGVLRHLAEQTAPTPAAGLPAPDRVREARGRLTSA
jgi:gamma-glutamyl:cysteine ligase YbdK (ATP-grasp superfamily)